MKRKGMMSIRNGFLRFLFGIYHVSSGVWRRVERWWWQRVCEGQLLFYKTQFPHGKVSFFGHTFLRFEKGAKVTIGEHFISRSGVDSDSIGNRSHSIIYVKGTGTLIIGNNTGMSNTAIYCHCSITIGNYVNIGAGTQIFDTDFHSLSWYDRQNGADLLNRKVKPVQIDDLVFIGADSIILKGVHIGEKSIIGAGSVVTQSIPSGEIWAGNPAVFIRKIED